MSNTIIGLALPLNSKHGNLFEVTFDTYTQAKFNFKNLILTNIGERIMLPTYGTNIMKVLFDPNTEELITSVKDSIMAATDTWCPYINITNLKVTNSDNDVLISISYTVSETTFVEQINLIVDSFGQMKLQ